MGQMLLTHKKDDLFTNYLKVIEAIRSKYFVMENVAGIFTKDNGNIKDRIIREIRNIVDYVSLKEFVNLCESKKILKRVESTSQKQELEICFRTLKSWIEQDRLVTQRRKDYLKVMSVIELPSRRFFIFQAETYFVICSC